MQQLATVVSLTTLALSVFVACRLFAAAWRTRGAPEIAMGSYQGLVVAAIALYAYLVRVAGTAEPERVFDLVVIANLLIAAGVVSLAIGIWRIYRASEAWAIGICVLLAAWVLGGWTWTSTGDVLPTTVAATAPNAFFVTGRSAVYLWGGFEGIRYHRMLRLRASLGLADPVIAHRILMWGLFSLTMGTLAVTSLVAGSLLGDAYSSWAPGQFITPAASLIASICLWLGFFPPAAYERFIARRAAAATPQADARA